VLGIAVLVGGPADVGVQAVVPSSLFRISSRALTTAARRDARVAWAVAEELNRRLHDTLQQTAVNVEPASDPARAPFTESLDVIGDGSLVLLATPGHTAGSLSLLIRRGTRPPLLVVERARLGVAFLGDGRRAAETMLENHWLAADALAARLGLAQRVRDSVEQTFERWDGKGVPKGASGEEILLTSRLVTLADVVEVFHRADGTDAAITVARERRGTQFDPQVVDIFAAEAASLFADLDEVSSWDAVISAEPALGTWVAGPEFDAALEAIADFTDVKSPYTIGHSRAVADLAGEAAHIFGLDGEAGKVVRRAGLVHDLGRLGVSNAIWDKQGRLSHAESERVRLHPYLTERMLAYSPALAPLAAVAVQHHERLDGSGYPRGLSGSAVSAEGRVLAAADFYHSRTEPRPHRPAGTADEAAAQLRAEARTGRMDAEAVAAVLSAAGHRAARRQARPAGLTGREVEVLRLLARGLSNKEIGEHLVISRKTAAHHVEHIYAKTGVANRALASLFAANHGLIGDSTGTNRRWAGSSLPPS
jgi:HD-GYP domain-containing protein (c-di-GMP phosphodiesterase class II)